MNYILITGGFGDGKKLLHFIFQLLDKQAFNSILIGIAAAGVSTLQQVQQRARRWRIGRHGWTRLAPGFKRIYRAGRRAAHAAHRRPDTLLLHEWRKQVQYLWHALQILKPLQSRAPHKLVSLARHLADYLGEEHDLALLQSTVLAFGRSHEQLSEPLLAAIDRRRRSLRLKAMASGKRLYAHKPRTMAARVGRCCVPRRA